MFDARRITGPDRRLLAYYAIRSLVLGPLFPVLLIPRAFRYHTLRYRFAEDGISMSWGVLFRHEIHLTYDRIQDIHLRSNIVERWLGLARVPIQTASGAAAAEMTIEGVPEFEALRDFIYERMRGASPATPESGAPLAPSSAALVEALDAVAAELREVRRALAAGRGDEGAP